MNTADRHTILVVDDEPNLIDVVRLTLEREGFDVLEAENGYKALRQLREHMPDMVLLDVMMPEMDGFETLREIRAASNVPVIMLTVQATETDRVRGLELGADDYVAKPFSHRELIGRIRAVLRRTQAADPTAQTSIVKVDDDLSVDFDRREAIVRGERIRLRPTEYKLLYHLIQNAGRLLTHDMILTRVWGREYRDDTQLLRLYITYLRQKIEPDPSHPRYILNERGLGLSVQSSSPLVNVVLDVSAAVYQHAGIARYCTELVRALRATAEEDEHITLFYTAPPRGDVKERHLDE